MAKSNAGENVIKLRDIKSLTADFGAIPDGSQSAADMLAACQAAWTSALANDHDLYAPAGTYTIGDASFPWRQSGTPATLLDCNNVTLYCEGPATIFKTASAAGADVFNLNGLKNFHVRGFPTLTGTISGTTSGSNGVSITNGWDNITLEVRALNLPSLDKTTYVDGGKALTVQPATTVNACGTLKAVVFAQGCSEGFGYEPDLVTAADKTANMDVALFATDCYIATKSVAAAASGALSSGISSGFKVRGFAVNCQQDVVLNRMHGGTVDMTVVTTKSAAARRLDSNGVAWRASDATVIALGCTYAKNAQIKVTGDKGACDTKVSLGGASAGSSGLGGSTQYCDIYLDIAGTGGTADLAAVDSGGNSLAESRLVCTPVTATSIPSDFYTLAKINSLSLIGDTCGSYTGTTTGLNPEVPFPVLWAKHDRMVTLYIGAYTGTSNQTYFTITGAPATIRPSAAREMLVRVQDNTGTYAVGVASMGTDGVITLSSTVGGGTWTAGGTKSIAAQSVSYIL